MPIGDGWYQSEWFGLFRVYKGVQWVYHAEFGWLYHGETNQNGIWFWSEGEGGSGVGWIHGPMYGDTIRVVGFIPLAFVRDDPLGGTIKPILPYLVGRRSIRVLGTIWSKFRIKPGTTFCGVCDRLTCSLRRH